MKKFGPHLIALILLIQTCVFLLVPKHPHHTWTINQHRSNLTCGAASCAVTGFTAIPAGSLIVGVGWSSAASQTAATGASGGGTWVVPSGCSGTSSCATSDASGGTAIVEYVLSSTGSPTSITVIMTTSGQSLSAAEVFAVSYTSSPASFDVGGTADRTTCTTCAGIGTSPTGNDIIIQYVACGQTCATSATAGFVGATPYSTGAGGVADFPIGDGVGAAINQSTGTAPNWSQSPTGTIGVGAIAFKETAGATAHIMPPVVF